MLGDDDPVFSKNDSVSWFLHKFFEFEDKGHSDYSYNLSQIYFSNFEIEKFIESDKILFFNEIYKQNAHFTKILYKGLIDKRTSFYDWCRFSKYEKIYTVLLLFLSNECIDIEITFLGLIRDFLSPMLREDKLIFDKIYKFSSKNFISIKSKFSLSNVTNSHENMKKYFSLLYEDRSHIFLSEASIFETILILLKSNLDLFEVFINHLEQLLSNITEIDANKINMNLDDFNLLVVYGCIFIDNTAKNIGKYSRLVEAIKSNSFLSTIDSFKKIKHLEETLYLISILKKYGLHPDFSLLFNLKERNLHQKEKEIDYINKILSINCKPNFYQFFKAKRFPDQSNTSFTFYEAIVFRITHFAFVFDNFLNQESLNITLDEYFQDVNLLDQFISNSSSECYSAIVFMILLSSDLEIIEKYLVVLIKKFEDLFQIQSSLIENIMLFYIEYSYRNIENLETIPFKKYSFIMSSIQNNGNVYLNVEKSFLQLFELMSFFHIKLSPTNVKSLHIFDTLDILLGNSIDSYSSLKNYNCSYVFTKSSTDIPFCEVIDLLVASYSDMNISHERYETKIALYLTVLKRAQSLNIVPDMICLVKLLLTLPQISNSSSHFLQLESIIFTILTDPTLKDYHDEIQCSLISNSTNIPDLGRICPAKNNGNSTLDFCSYIFAKENMDNFINTNLYKNDSVSSSATLTSLLIKSLSCNSNLLDINGYSKYLSNKEIEEFFHIYENLLKDVIKKIESKTNKSNKIIHFDEEILKSIEKIGFSRNGAMRAILATNGEGKTQAIEWAINHSNDKDFDYPVIIPLTSDSLLINNQPIVDLEFVSNCLIAINKMKAISCVNISLDPPTTQNEINPLEKYDLYSAESNYMQGCFYINVIHFFFYL